MIEEKKKRNYSGKKTYGGFESDIGYMIAQQFKLLVAFIILLSQVLILLFQFSQLISDPFLYSRCFCFHLSGVLKSQLPL